jgi:hypothetical protein
VYVTGDLRHHVTLDALEQGLALVDAGHHATEVAAMPAWLERLQADAGQHGLRGPGGSVARPDRPLEVSVPDYTPEQLDLLLELQATDQRVRRSSTRSTTCPSSGSSPSHERGSRS